MSILNTQSGISPSFEGFMLPSAHENGVKFQALSISGLGLTIAGIFFEIHSQELCYNWLKCTT